MTTHQIIVKGKVQGVYFRQSTKLRAKELGLSGTVENLPDGTVKIVVTGTGDQLAEMSAWCKQGPPAAVVTDVIVSKLPLQEFDGFSVV